MNCVDFPRETIDGKLNEALELLLKNDAYLLQADVNERSITHVLAIYLKQVFNNWDVDCEYNRKHNNSIKRISDYCPKTTNTDNTNARTVYPDIIIHHRKCCENLVVIEVKKENNTATDDCDIRKLRAFKEELKYCYAIFLKIKTRCKDYNSSVEHYITSEHIEVAIS
jgi:hypothetical protein